jgi:methylated-DNA-[protein]-cysteine S-methyltransferase
MTATTNTSGFARYCEFESPIGRLLVAYQGSTILAVAINTAASAFAGELTERVGAPPQRDATAPNWLADALLSQLDGRGEYEHYDLSPLTEFQQRVLQATAAIPRGQVRTYGQIAAAIGAPGAARAVGTALARNPVPILIPCHRVIRAGGKLGNYGAGGESMKRRLLDHEGALPLA